MYIYDFEVKTIKNENLKLDIYRDYVILIVNVASKCGFTVQYSGLEKLYREFKDKNFVILGFPCGQFLNQELENEEKIEQFCKLTYDVTFPLFAKVDVNGKNTAPLFKYLKSEAKGVLNSENIKWNFTKFLIDRNGKVFNRYAPATTPETLRGDIERLVLG